MKKAEDNRNRESPAQFENIIKLSVYVKRVTRSSMYARKISSVACGFSHIKIYFSDYPKSLISRINEVNVLFSI